MNKLFAAAIIMLSLSIWGCQGNSQTDQPIADIPSITLPDSVFTSTTVPECRKYLKHSEVELLDVRTQEEFDQGHIENALLIDVKNKNFADLVGKLDKQKTYIVYCRSGRRSLTASDIMIKQGFTRIINMEGGYNAWKIE